MAPDFDFTNIRHTVSAVKQPQQRARLQDLTERFAGTEVGLLENSHEQPE